MIKKNKVFLGVLLVLVVILGGSVLFYQSQFQKTTNQALAIAYKDAKVAKKDVIHQKIDKEFENFRGSYEIEFNTKSAEYSYHVDVKTGQILERDMDNNGFSKSTSQSSSSSSQKSHKISQEEAKKIAFKDANIEESEVSNLKIKEEIENGKSVYDIDFVDLKNKNEVDYQIDAETGKIIERSRDHMND